MREWKNVELNKKDAGVFRVFLRSLKVKFETSGVGELTHFECLVSPIEENKANIFLGGLA